MTTADDEDEIPCIYVTDYDINPLTLRGAVLVMVAYVQQTTQFATSAASNDTNRIQVDTLLEWIPIIDGNTRSLQHAAAALCFF